MTSDQEDQSLLDPAVLDDPFEFYAYLQAKKPVYQMPETGFYVVTRYADLRKVLMDHRTFSNNVNRAEAMQGGRAAIHARVLAEKGWPHMQLLQRADPPEHRLHRKLVDRVFSPQRVEELTPRIEQIVAGLIDQWIDRGECEFVSEFAVELPAAVIAEQIGLGANSRTFRHWAHALHAPGHQVLTEEELAACAEIEVEMQHHLAAEFALRRAAPRDDLISALAHAHMADEEPLGVQEMQTIMWHIIAAGVETTASAISHGMWLLIRNPDQFARLRSDRALLKNFIEEAIRMESPVQGLRRRATCDTEIAGVRIPEGSIVITRYGAANRDPAQFPCPHRFDIARENAGTHLGFGLMTHFCLGASLARREISCAFEALLDCLDDIALARPLLEPAHEPSFSNYVLKELPLRFRRAAPI